jgi:proteasome lid subunit RPN8/RPN11
MICENIKNKIKSHSLKLYPEECCGILLLKNNKLHTFECENIAQDRINEFKINPDDYLKASMNGKIIGIYHSHCVQDNSFSELDKQVSHKLNLKNIVYILKKDSFEEYSPENYYNKYINKNFAIGKSDCVSIIEDYYNEEFGIKIFHYQRSEGWDLNYKRFIEDKLKSDNLTSFDGILNKENFIKINSINEAKKHDLVVFKYLDNYPSHFGIYLGQNYILHQPRDRKSIIEKLSDSEKRRIYCFARHKQLC